MNIKDAIRELVKLMAPTRRFASGETLWRAVRRKALTITSPNHKHTYDKRVYMAAGAVLTAWEHYYCFIGAHGERLAGEVQEERVQATQQ